MAKATQTTSTKKTTTTKKLYTAAPPSQARKFAPPAAARCDMSQHIDTRRKLKDVSLIEEFEDLLSKCTLSEVDKEMLRLHYIEEKDFRYIGDALGYTERTIKARHKRALKKLSDVL